MVCSVAPFPKICLREWMHALHANQQLAICGFSIPVLGTGCDCINCVTQNHVAAVGFEPTPPKRLVPKTSALDRSATLP